ncbi:hypothetical protein ILUMI_07762 [Ignelater luminosus]|uniref:Galectin n=1 Tax=Ignelater luminosus TaxID=2038154 RepID=A0A8K0D2V6_IGNLU|nr:hypothetical protein ILUMI_07762 [Ignelater luminosus]
MDEPIFDPPIPYIGPIQTRFIPGKVIKIQGTVPAVAYRFNINLQCGSQTSPQDDIAIQIAVKVLDGYIGLNSLQNSIWGEEQLNLTLQIKRAEKFEIILKCEFSQYKITINGTHHCEFPQRIHYDQISHLAIDGDVSIIQISYEHDSSSGSVDGPKAPLIDELQNCHSVNAAFTPSPGFTDPPPYSVVPSNDTEQYPPQYTNPYPTQCSSNPPYPSQLNNPPYPSQLNNPPYPSQSNNVPYPYPTTYSPYSTNVASGMPYPTNTYLLPGAPGAVSFNVYPVPGTEGIAAPPPPGAPVPLNAASSNFRPVKRSRLRRTCAICWSVLLIVIGVVVIIIVKVLRKGVIHKKHSHSSSSYSSSNDRW